MKVMVVEDNADVRETMRDFLQLSGHDVTVAVDGPSAVEALIASGRTWRWWTSACRASTATRCSPR
jgi:DNA-binding NtrC family response regulator